MDSMSAFELVLIFMAVVVLGGGWIMLDRAANRWFAELPEEVRRRGYLGILLHRLLGRK